jgi:hypothetical protein
MLQRAAGGFGYLALQSLLAGEQARSAVVNPSSLRANALSSESEEDCVFVHEGWPQPCRYV